MAGWRPPPGLRRRANGFAGGRAGAIAGEWDARLEKRDGRRRRHIGLAPGLGDRSRRRHRHRRLLRGDRPVRQLQRRIAGIPAVLLGRQHVDRPDRAVAGRARVPARHPRPGRADLVRPAGQRRRSPPCRSACWWPCSRPGSGRAITAASGRCCEWYGQTLAIAEPCALGYYFLLDRRHDRRERGRGRAAAGGQRGRRRPLHRSPAAPAWPQPALPADGGSLCPRPHRTGLRPDPDAIEDRHRRARRGRGAAGAPVMVGGRAAVQRRSSTAGTSRCGSSMAWTSRSAARRWPGSGRRAGSTSARTNQTRW